VWRTREAAREPACRFYIDDCANPANPSRWFPSSVDPFDPEAHYRHFVSGMREADLLEIELHETKPAGKEGKVHVVARRCWGLGHDDPPSHEERVPVAAFTDREAAEARCRELEEEERERFEPYDRFSQHFEPDQRAVFRAAVERLGFAFEQDYVQEWLE